MRGIGTVYAGLIMLLALASVAVYTAYMGKTVTQAIYEQQQLYEHARFIAEHANITGSMIELPEPADIIVVDPQGIPHVARNVQQLQLPWRADQSKIYVAKTGRLRVGAADPVASSIAALASVASAPLTASSSIDTEQLSQEADVAQLIARGYLDPLFVDYSDVLDPNNYRGYLYQGSVSITLPPVTVGSLNTCHRQHNWTLARITVGSSVVTVVGETVTGNLYVYVDGELVFSGTGSATLVEEIGGHEATISVSNRVGRDPWCYTLGGGYYTGRYPAFKVTVSVPGLGVTISVGYGDGWGYREDAGTATHYMYPGLVYRVDSLTVLGPGKVVLEPAQSYSCYTYSYGSCSFSQTVEDKRVIDTDSTATWTLGGETRPCSCLLPRNPGPSRYIVYDYSDGVGRLWGWTFQPRIEGTLFTKAS